MTGTLRRTGRWRRIRALIRKESLQVLRDPSSFVVAFVLPALLLLLFGFGISFDATRVKVGLVIEEPTPETAWFVASLSNTPFFDVHQAADRRGFIDELSAGRLDGVVVLSGDFSERLARGDTAGVQVITDGCWQGRAAYGRTRRISPPATIISPSGMSDLRVQG